MGEEFYIITSPQDILAVFKETSSLEFDPIVQEIMSDFGLTSSSLNKMFDRKHDDQCWMDLCHINFKLQMNPGDKLERLQKIFLGNIDDALQWSRIRGSMVLSLNENNHTKAVSLWRWCGSVLVDSATRAFFGDAIYEVAPDILQDFFIFDNEGWKLSYKYPHFAARRMYEAKSKSELAFAQYLALPRERRQDASWIVQMIEQGMTDIHIGSTQMAPMPFILYRLINTNAYKLCFWCVSFLLHDPELWLSIENEMTPAFGRDGSLSMVYLLDSCPQLGSFYEEVLRITNDPIGTRLVVRSVKIGNKKLLPGRKILMPYRQMHYDPSVFGGNSLEFDATRFLNKKQLSRSTSYRPFGGAATHCPGRFLARREVYMFLALVLNRFEIRLSNSNGGEKHKFPTMNTTIPSGGIITPVAGDDVILEVKIKPSFTHSK